MNLGLIVEGPTDAAAYPELIRRIRQDLEPFQVRPCGGKSRLKGRFVDLLDEFHRNHAWRIQTAFVIRDSDCQPSQTIEGQLNGILDDSGFRPHFPVKFFATKCDLETWLVADEDAINRVSQQRGTNKVVNAIGIQLEVAKADQLFSQQLSRADLNPVPPVYAGVARSLDIEKVAALCPSFRRFINELRSC